MHVFKRKHSVMNSKLATLHGERIVRARIFKNPEIVFLRFTVIIYPHASGDMFMRVVESNQVDAISLYHIRRFTGSAMIMAARVRIYTRVVEI